MYLSQLSEFWGPPQVILKDCLKGKPFHWEISMTARISKSLAVMLLIR